MLILSIVYVLDILNADFIAGKVEDVLQNVLWRFAGQDVVLVVDPPRAGLRMSHFGYFSRFLRLILMSVIEYIEKSVFDMLI